MKIEKENWINFLFRWIYGSILFWFFMFLTFGIFALNTEFNQIIFTSYCILFTTISTFTASLFAYITLRRIEYTGKQTKKYFELNPFTLDNLYKETISIILNSILCSFGMAGLIKDAFGLSILFMIVYSVIKLISMFIARLIFKFTKKINYCIVTVFSIFFIMLILSVYSLNFVVIHK